MMDEFIGSLSHSSLLELLVDMILTFENPVSLEIAETDLMVLGVKNLSSASEVKFIHRE